MRYLLLPVMLCLTLGAASSRAAQMDMSTVSVEQLIDALTLIDKPAPGIDGGALYLDFMADDAPPQFTVGLLGVPPPEIPPQMRELVRRGVLALPSLIGHLPDERPTRLTVGGDMFMLSSWFSDEYDWRLRIGPQYYSFKQLFGGTAHRKALGGTYVVRVGDVCYALIGQIVNRRLIAVRYQPSGNLIVNSPIEAPELIDRIKSDWGGLDARSHEAALLSDIRLETDIRSWSPAMARLRFYYPAAYASLRGDDLEKRAEFERAEAGNQQ